jgi:hypothetical protein
MLIADLIISGVIFLLQKGLVQNLPLSLTNFPIGELKTNLQQAKDILGLSIANLNVFLPVALLLAMIISMIAGEIYLALFKAGKFIINLIRGSGA